MCSRIRLPGHTGLFLAAIAPMVYVCGNIAWFFLVQKGPGLEERAGMSLSSYALALAYPVSIVLFVCGVVALCRNRLAPRERRAGIAAWSTILTAAWLCPLAAIYYLPDTHLPSLLRRAGSSDQEIYACGKPNGFESPEMVSPEISERVAKKFPRGARARDLRAWLESQKFKIEPWQPCADDASIHVATFDEPPDRLFTINVRVYWKTDSSGKISWTTGTISWTSI